MFEKILIANLGDQSPLGDAAAQPNRMAAEGRESDFTTRHRHV